MVKRRKNPEQEMGFGDAAKSVYARMDAKKAEGKRLAEANRAHIEKMVREGRYGAGQTTLNMIRALKMMPWENTVADWQRLYEAEMIVKLSRAKGRKVNTTYYIGEPEKRRKPSSAELNRMGREVAREYVSRYGHPNEDQHRRNPGRSAPAPDMQAARELMLYIVNDEQLYRKQTQHIIKKIQIELKHGTFDKAKAYQLWLYLADSGAVKYTREHGSAGDRNLFDMPTRRAAAKLLHGEYQEEIGMVEGRRSNPYTLGTEVFEEGMGYSFQLVAGGKAYLARIIYPSREEATRALERARKAYGDGTDAFDRLTTPFRGRTYKVPSISTKRGREMRRTNPASTKGWLHTAWIIVRASDKMVFCREGSRNVWVKKQFESSGVRGVPIPWNYASNKRAVKAHAEFSRRGAIRPSDGKIWFMTWNDYVGYLQNGWKDARGYDVTSIIG